MRRVFVAVVLRGLIMLADTEDLARLYTPASYTIKWTTLPWEANEVYKLRRAVFCIEQGIFMGDDRDEIDERAQLIVAVRCIGGGARAGGGGGAVFGKGPGGGGGAPAPRPA